MKASDLAQLAVRIVAVFVVMQGLLVVAAVVPAIPDVEIVTTIALVGLALPMVAGVILWFVAPRVGRLAVSEPESVVEISGISLYSLTASAFVVVGVILFVTSVPVLLTSIIKAFINPELFSASWAVGSLIKVIFSIGLLLRSDFLAILLLKIKMAGNVKKEL